MIVQPEKPLPPLTERMVQHAIYLTYVRGSSHLLAIPNSCLFGWEADMVSMTKARYLHEYEIKVSRADFLKELKAVAKAGTGEDRGESKVYRHEVLSGRLSRPGWSRNWTDAEVEAWKAKVMRRRPNCFWFVVADGICDVSEVPDYAGLLVATVNRWSERAQLREVRKAPRLHTEKAGEEDVLTLARGACFRFWDHVFPHANDNAPPAAADACPACLPLVGPDLARRCAAAGGGA